MSVELTTREIQDKYHRLARWYDPIEGVLEWLGIAGLRQRLIARAHGEVLEVAAGTGNSLRYYPSSCHLTLSDLSPDMLAIAAGKQRTAAKAPGFLLCDTEKLPFPGGSFDTVVSTLSLCTYPHPLAALAEMKRVCRPSGKLLLLEHGRSSQPMMGRFQDRYADRHARALACHWNREPQELVTAAGLRLTHAARCCWGIFHLLEAQP